MQVSHRLNFQMTVSIWSLSTVPVYDLLCLWMGKDFRDAPTALPKAVWGAWPFLAYNKDWSPTEGTLGSMSGPTAPLGQRSRGSGSGQISCQEHHRGA